MPGLIVVAATATGVQPTRALFVGGTNVLDGAGGASYGVPVDSIEVVEAGPGGVSSMDFTIDDPAKEVTLTEGQEVQFWNIPNNYLIFRGWVDHWTDSPAFGTGRAFAVTCVGIEALLDWTKVGPTYTVVDDSGTPIVGLVSLPWVISRLTQTSSNIIRAPMNYNGTGDPGAPFTRNGSFTYPVGTTVSAGPGPLGLYYIASGGPLPTVTVGQLSLREAINRMIDMANRRGVGGGSETETSAATFVTLDWYLGLRVWEDRVDGTSSQQPDDYTALTIVDTTAGGTVAENLEHNVEPNEPIRAVYVNGSSAFGWFYDGSGVNGRQEIINDSTITTAEIAERQARNLMAEQRGSVRGSFTLTDYNPSATIHAGSILSLTDANLGLNASVPYRIMEIRKRFRQDDAEHWTISYGGQPPSATRLIRKLTRGVAA